MEVESSATAADVWNQAIRRRMRNMATRLPAPEPSSSPWVDKLAIGAYTLAAIAIILFVIVVSSQVAPKGSSTGGNSKTRPAMIQIGFPTRPVRPPPVGPARPPPVRPARPLVGPPARPTAVPDVPSIVEPPEEIDTAPRPSDFISVRDNQFEVNCQPFYVAGFNAHDLIEISLLKTGTFEMENDVSGHLRVRETFKQASAAGLNVVRIWGFTHHDSILFQTAPGEYVEESFKGLDYVLNEARQFGMRVIIAFTDNWKYLNGADQFIDWSDTAPRRTEEREPDKGQEPTDPDASTYETMRHTLFFMDSGTKQHYKNHVKSMLLRKNSIHGVQYKDDPTIFGWNLINEPRCRPIDNANCTEAVQTWIEEMSEYVKKLDPNHLVTIGSEGFFGGGKPWSHANPGTWAESVGQSFVENHSPGSIDFAAIHSWPDNWDRPDLEFQKEWIGQHGQVSKAELGKPLILEEFGKRLEPDLQDDLESIFDIRDPFFAETLGAISNNIANGQGVSGALFWRLHLPTYAGSNRGRYGVKTTDTTFRHVTRFAGSVQSAIHSRPPRQECNAQCWVPYSNESRDFCIRSETACGIYWDVQNGRGEYQKVFSKDVNVSVWDHEVPLSDLRFFASWSECCRKGVGAFKEGCTLDLGYSSW